MQIVDEFGMEIGGGLVVRTPSGFAPKYSPGCPLGFRAMVATANETQQPYSVNRNTSQRLPSQRKRNSSLVHLMRSMSMLTVNADQHPLMKNFHRPEDEKRMVVILDEGEFEAWLHPGLKAPERMLRCMDAEMLMARG